MAQGSENDLLDIRYYQESFGVLGIAGGTGPDNDPIVDLNLNTLIVDNKAILARNTADSVTSDLAAHVGAVGPLEHADATIVDDGFMSAADKIKLDGIQNKAQNNVLALDDALSLISHKDTILHLHPIATTLLDGFMSAANKLKLDGIENGAEVNNITQAQDNILTGGGLADTLHTHDHSPGSETFTELVHSTTDHTGVTGVPGFPGFVTAETYFPSPEILVGRAVQIFSHTYSFAPEIVQCGWRRLRVDDFDTSDGHEIQDIQISGNDGIVTWFKIGWQNTISVWQGAFG